MGAFLPAVVVAAAGVVLLILVVPVVAVRMRRLERAAARLRSGVDEGAAPLTAALAQVKAWRPGDGRRSGDPA
ncbi:hypothetical protein [Pseudonocardia asaccharolytica]|uniref:Uncharacterized protein n=1 Tax=Pseudonocardia asaccharolytica DSM 44247 = NBRC 16224 TaxID=1123024 RepID=A0A511D5G1_9PSEU|nr:hypothetical protein [Pseudonocardia asaccharolytica]GEL19693.1 hypothetical protein PA7_35300 [Pseudonocardia asaccharolytica DSM 44247 = NBRC 16224]